MNLESAIALKQRVLAQLGLDPGSAAAAATPPRAARADAGWPRELSPGITERPQLALGVAAGEHGYTLAVRLQRDSAVEQAAVYTIARAAGCELDVALVGPIRATHGLAGVRGGQWQRGIVLPPCIGASASHQNVDAGTLGAFVKCDGYVCALSNNHVFADSDRARTGDPIVQPSLADGGDPLRGRIGSLLRSVPLLRSSANLADAAIARLREDIGFDATTLRGIDNGRDRTLTGQSVAVLREQVFKIGRTSGVTEGTIGAVALDNVLVHFDTGWLRFDHCIEIRPPSPKQRFEEDGDSGAIVVDSRFRAVGLLFAGTRSGEGGQPGLAYANDIGKVLTRLGATLLY